LDEFDFIFSSESKLVELLKKIDKENYFKLIGIVNSSGTSLIGDDLEKIIKKSKLTKDHIIVETTGHTDNVSIGFQNTVIKILDKLLDDNCKENVKKEKNAVNLIGFSLTQYNWFNDLKEIENILSMVGLKVNTVICSATDIEKIRSIGKAKLNIIISEEYGGLIGKYLFDKLDMPYIGIGPDISSNRSTEEKIVYSPYGFEFTDNLINSLKSYYNIKLDDYIKERDMIKRRAYLALRGFQGARGFFKGLTFGIFADSYVVFPLLKFLYEYLGLYPKIIGLRSIGKVNYSSVKKYLKENNLKTVLLDFYNQIDLKDAFYKEDLDVVFGSSLEKNIIRYSGKETSFINISIPGDERSIITFRPLMGINGVLTLVEELINSIKVRNFNYKY
jgi:nitrogenase molybdenum-iron protein alpha/beta subunit